MEIRLPEIQAIIDELKNDSQAMANGQVRTALEQLDGIFGELELQEALAHPSKTDGDQPDAKKIATLIAPVRIFEDASKQKSLLDLLLKGFDEIDQKAPLFDLIHQIAIMYWRLGENLQAAEYCKRILDLTAAGSYPKIRAEAYRQLGHLQFDQQRWNQAESYYQQCLALFEAENHLAGMASIYNRLGSIAFYQGDYEIARINHQKAIDIGAQNGHYKQSIAAAYNGLGMIASVQANWDVTVDYLAQSIEIYEELGRNEVAAGIYMNLAMAYADAEEWEAAGECYAEATAVAKESGDLLFLSKIHMNRAEFLLNMTNIDAAQVYCDKALDTFKKSENNNGIADGYKLYGRIYRHQQEWDLAIDTFTKSIGLYQSCQIPQGEAEGCYEFGLMYKDMRNPSQARYFLRRSRQLYVSLGAADEIKRINTALADLTL